MGEVNEESKELLQSNETKERKNNMGRPLKYPGGWDSVKAAYMRKYAQEKLIGEFFCPICNSKFLYKTTVHSHLKKSVKCNRVRLQKELEEIKNKPPDN